MNKLTAEQVLAMHRELIAEYGGTDGLLDRNLFESALEMPFQTFDGSDLFPSVQQKAVRLGFGLIMNHPFFDGNKRIGTHVMLVTLAMNEIELVYSQEELYETILEVASGNLSYDGLLEWVLIHEIIIS